MAHTLIKNQKKYWAIIFVENKNVPIKLRMDARGFRPLYYWLSSNYPNWTSINVYDRSSGGQRGSFVLQLRANNYWNKIESL